ncbi:exodeoxyribonuclease VII large subunit, partial [Campylobacter hepaticus]
VMLCYAIEKQFYNLIINQLSFNKLKLEKLQNAYLQHENFFNKSKKFVCVKKDNKIISLEELKADDMIILTSQTSQKEAKIL